jgi:hypothetical protein
MLEWLGQPSESLIVLNHPMWDENHIGEAEHRESAEAFLDAFGPLFHALELNGLRPWKENQKTIQLAERYRLPAISGGTVTGESQTPASI